MDTPVAMVNLIDEREQHLVGLLGGPSEFASRRLSVDVGFCPSTLLTGRPRFVEDAHEDPEFLDNPAVTELGFVAYAGAPLRDGDGNLVGTLCVTDVRPRRWRQVDQRALEALAVSVVSELALHSDIDRRARLLEAFDVAPAAIAVTRGPQHEIEYLNPAYRSIFGDLPVGVPSRIALPSLPADFFALMDQVAGSGEGFSASGAAVTMTWPGEAEPRERFFDFSYSPVRRERRWAAERDGRGRASSGIRGLLVVAVEVTDRVHATRELRRRARSQEVLARASAAVHRGLDPAMALRALAAAALPEFADVSTVHLLSVPPAPGTPVGAPVSTQRTASESCKPQETPPVDVQVTWPAGSGLARAISTGTTVVQSFDVDTPPWWTYGVGGNEVVRAGVHAAAFVPVIVDQRVVAVAIFGCGADRPVWSGPDLMVLDQLADYAGHALAQSLQYQHTRHTALVLQRSLLTEPPHVPGLQICARYRPAGTDEIGGDWYDVVSLGQGRIGVMVGDVVGHDIIAAAAMGQLRATLRSLITLHPDDGPAVALEALAIANEKLAITRYATVVAGTLTQAKGGWRLRWARAGHPPPLLVSPDGRAEFLPEGAGAALGVGIRGQRADTETAVPFGATLLLYTDGLVESRSGDLDTGMEHLRSRCAGSSTSTLADVCDEVLREASDQDDVAILAIRVPHPTP